MEAWASGRARTQHWAVQPLLLTLNPSPGQGGFAPNGSLPCFLPIAHTVTAARNGSRVRWLEFLTARCSQRTEYDL